MDLNNSADMLLHFQNLQRQVQEAQERERLWRQQLEERDQQLEERERLWRQQLEERDQQIEERDQQLRLHQRPLIRKYVRLCQSIYYDAMLVERRPGRMVKGALTKVKGKYHPRKLEELHGFKEELQKIFDEACGLFPPDHRGFDSESSMRAMLENRIREIGHESTLSVFVLDHIETPVKKILEELKIVDEDGVFLARDEDIKFELEPQEISAHMGGPSAEPPQSDINIEIEPADVPPATPLYRKDLGHFHPDRICLRSVVFQDSTHENITR
ncbi:hypothetical protein E4U52_007188 [Claviceps spartinae]|nr:hypothetical protein E4U52_007188 [Claviceps spartinae]